MPVVSESKFRSPAHEYTQDYSVFPCATPQKKALHAPIIMSPNMLKHPKLTPLLCLPLWPSSNSALRVFHWLPFARRCLRVHCRCDRFFDRNVDDRSRTMATAKAPAVRATYTMTTLAYELLSRSWMAPVPMRTMMFILQWALLA